VGELKGGLKSAGYQAAINAKNSPSSVDHHRAVVRTGGGMCMGNGDGVVCRKMGAMRRREVGGSILFQKKKRWEDQSRCSSGSSRVGREVGRWGEGHEYGVEAVVRRRGEK